MFGIGKQLISAIKIGFAVFCTVLLTAALTAPPAWGAAQSAAQPTITLDVKNEPLGSVLAKITRKTKWKIKAPEKWLNRLVTQTLNKATLEEGLTSVLNNAGVANLLLMYDENIKVVTLFDTESAQKQAADRSSAPANSPPSVMSVTGEPDPVLQRAAERKAGSAPARVNRRARRQASDDD